MAGPMISVFHIGHIWNQANQRADHAMADNVCEGGEYLGA